MSIFNKKLELICGYTHVQGVKEVLVKCKNCKKKKQLLTRGVCSNCYRRMNYAIQTGKVTAEQLEDAGLWLEKRGRGPIEDFAAKVAK